ncbi:hypothetical protein V3C99_016931, partial [Haemonchus contortus]
REKKMIGKENDVCIKLVEYSKNGRVFRKWSYERLGERVKDTKWQDPSCPCDMADRITEENELEEKDHRHERSSGSPLARTLKQQRVVRQERDMEKEEEAITNILKMQAEMERKREVNIKRDKQKFEQRFDQFDKRNKGDSYNEITYQPTRKDFKVRRSRTSGTSAGGDQPVTWEESCDLKIERHSDQEDTKEHLVIHRRHRKTHSKPHHVHDKDPTRRSLPK